ncbi:MAG: pilus assembly protein PilM [Deltaproteobacteria bacterium]|nr:pilus assembly protein PilM [Deltaproteobacteria bacterium]
MARLVCGIDVGTGSVRAAVLRVGLRSSESVALVETPLRVPDDGGPVEAGAMAEALGELAAKLPRGIESRAAALSGSDATIRILGFPRAALRQAEAAVRIELEGQLPFEPSEAVVDHMLLSQPGADPASLLVAVARTETVRALVASLAAHGLDPGSLAVGALPLLHLLPHGHAALTEDGVSILDMGRLETDLLVLRGGRPAFLRSFRVGAEDVTRAIAKAFRVPRGEAEAVKVTRLSLAEDPAALADPAMRALVEAAQGGLAALLGPLRRTVVELRARGSDAIEPARVLLTGGGSRIPGLAPFLAQRLGVPVETLAASVPAPPKAPPDALPAFGRAIGIALSGVAPRSRRLDLRQGEVRYRGDAAAARASLRNVAIAAALALLCWIFHAWTQHRALDREAAQQKTALERATLEVMGKKYSDFAVVRSLVSKASPRIEGPVPRADALDILAQLARTMPSEIRNNITLLDIEPGKLAINGMTRNAEEAARIPKVLEEYEECVRDVGTLSGSGSEGNYTYQIEATTICP